MAKLIFIKFRHGISVASPRGWCGGRLLLRVTNRMSIGIAPDAGG